MEEIVYFKLGNMHESVCSTSFGEFIQMIRDGFFASTDTVIVSSDSFNNIVSRSSVDSSVCLSEIRIPYLAKEDYLSFSSVVPTSMTGIRYQYVTVVNGHMTTEQIKRELNGNITPIVYRGADRGYVRGHSMGRERTEGESVQMPYHRELEAEGSRLVDRQRASRDKFRTV